MVAVLNRKEGALARLRDIGDVWKTIKELDVQAIKTEAEQDLRIVLVGMEEGCAQVAQLLRAGHDRYPACGNDPLEVLAPPIPRQRQNELSRAALLIQVLFANQSLTDEAYLTYEKLIVTGVPCLLVVIGGSTLPARANGQPEPDWREQRTIFLNPPASIEAVQLL